MLWLASLPFLVLGFALCPVPLDPDTLFTRAELAGVLCFFVFWCLALLAWGRLAARALALRSEEGWLALPLGTAWAALGAALLGHLGLIGESARGLLVAVLLSGPVLEAYFTRKSRPRARARPWLKEWRSAATRLRSREARLEAALWGLVVLAVFARIVRASLPHFHSDPLSYHLVGPRLWFEAGHIYLPESLPMAMFASAWEYLFIWAQSLLGGSGSLGLVEAQLFSQYAHVVLGYAGSALALERLLARLELRGPWRAVAVLAGIASWFLLWTSWLAKSDWGTVLWALSGIYLLLEARLERRRALLAGLFLGLAATKTVNLLPLAAVLGCWLWRRPARAQLVAVGGGMLAGLAPVAARNWVLTGNPIFPALDSVFHSPWLSDSMRRLYAVSPAAPALTARLAMLARHEPLVLAGLPLAVWLVAKKRARGARLVLVAPWSALALFAALIGPGVGIDDGTLHLRWLGFALVLAPAFAVLALHELLATSRLKKHGSLLALLAGVALLWHVNSDFHLFTDVVHAANPALAVRNVAMGGASKAWLRLNAKPTEPVVTTGDNQVYYLLGLPVAVVPDQPMLDQLTRDVTDPLTCARKLRGWGARFVLDTAHYESRYWSPLAQRLDALAHRCPTLVAFTAPDSRVLDLEKLPACRP